MLHHHCCCRFQTILFLLSLLLLSVVRVSVVEGIIQSDHNKNNDEFQEFILACSEGELEDLQAALKKHPDWINESSAGGETCLHVAGIHGQHEVTKAILAAGGDPNLMSQVVEDPESDFHIHMHALSWHVFGGHVQSAQTLLEHGADPNQPMDSIMDKGKKVTVLDMLNQLIEEEEEGLPELEPFHQMRELLLKHGAKSHEEL